MAIGGIVVATNAEPIRSVELQMMVSAMKIAEQDENAVSVSEYAAFGATSSTRNICTFVSDSLVVICDVDFLGLAPNHDRTNTSDNTASFIARSYMKNGVSFLTELSGGFAVALWNKQTRELLLARDRLGIQPLSYYATDTQIVFASHLRGIFATKRVPKEVNYSALADYLNYAVVPAPDTSFKNIRKLNPGEYLLWRGDVSQTYKYWDMVYPEDTVVSPTKLAHELLERMEESVRSVSVDLDPSRTGCFLSGGTDSSSIVGILTNITDHPVNTFSVGFSENRFNELSYAQLAATAYGAKHHEYILGPEDTMIIINRLVDAYDEPFGNASAVPTSFCVEAARDAGMGVLLAGDGGDELFGGNERYRVHALYSYYCALPSLMRKSLIQPAVSTLSSHFGLFTKLDRHIRRASLPDPDRYCLRRLIQEFPVSEIQGSSLPVADDRLAKVRFYYNSAPAKSELNRLLYVDVKMTLGDDDLRKVVRTAELARLRVRFPYLDHRLVEFSGRLPVNLKVHYLNKRYLFKKATMKLLPQAIINKQKHGFALPIGLWLKTNPALREMHREVFFDPRTYQRGYFSRRFIENLMSKMELDSTPYYGELLFELLMLELWHRRHAGP
jgi:asparagine synthase (glutamine-hydrolysing)